MPTINYEWQNSNPPKPDVYLTRNGDTKHQIPRYWDGEHWYGLIAVSPGEKADKERIKWDRDSYEPPARRKSWQTKYEYIGRKLPVPKLPKVAKQMYWGLRYSSYTDTELLNHAISMNLIGPLFRQHMNAILNGQEPIPAPAVKAKSIDDTILDFLEEHATELQSLNQDTWNHIIKTIPPHELDRGKVPHQVRKGDCRLVGGVWMECKNPANNTWVETDNKLATHEITAGYYPGTGEIELSWAQEGAPPVFAKFPVTEELGKAISNAVWPCVASSAVALPPGTMCLWRDAKTNLPEAKPNSISASVLTYSAYKGLCVQHTINRDVKKLLPKVKPVVWSDHEPDFWTPIDQRMFNLPGTKS